MENTLINIGMYITYILAVVAIAAMLFFSLMHIFADLKKQKTTLIGLGALVVIFIISYIIASGTDVPQELFDKVGLSSGTSKLIGASLIPVYILGVLSVLAIIYSEVSRAFKK